MPPTTQEITQLLKDHRDVVGRLWTALEEIARLEPFGRPAREYLYRSLDNLQKAREDLAEALDRIDPEWDEVDSEEEPNTFFDPGGDSGIAAFPDFKADSYSIVKEGKVIWQGNSEDFAALLGSMEWEESEFGEPPRYRRLVSKFYPVPPDPAPKKPSPYS